MTTHKRKISLRVILLHEKLVNEEQMKTLSSTFFYNLTPTKVYFKLEVFKSGGILIKTRTKKVKIWNLAYLKQIELKC
ncbi:conserved hypothetical protein [Vibrio crassostreae]|nr:conserved hypothetical protein [Vibrio crassostreae]CAK2172965.1 conserved hypothetical protein [Vibrio crassostreae]CAK2174377.1 conserved hypothetical protein [Vibrio crassostreae]CAK2175091.1 conserved hypothetical protein [Vibrio crassostreae]CAK2183127.1 conserved hypothetical protein [Vibrio crassostreae]